jgi:hypothetical protein
MASLIVGSEQDQTIRTGKTMNARHATLITATPRLQAATPRPAISLVATLGLMLATTAVAGQDRIRIVENPRTAMRESRSISPQRSVAPKAIRNAVQPRRAVEREKTSVVYVEHFVTEMRDQYRTVYVPIIEQQTEPTRSWWNPLGFSARTFRPRPVVRWEQRVEKTRVSIRYKELVPETAELPRPTSKSTSANGSIRTAAVGNWTGVKPRSTGAANDIRQRN